MCPYNLDYNNYPTSGMGAVVDGIDLDTGVDISNWLAGPLTHVHSLQINLNTFCEVRCVVSIDKTATQLYKTAVLG